MTEQPRFRDKYVAGQKFTVSEVNYKGIPVGTVLTWTGEDSYFCGMGFAPLMRKENGERIYFRDYWLRPL